MSTLFNHPLWIRFKPALVALLGIYGMSCVALLAMAEESPRGYIWLVGGAVIVHQLLLEFGRIPSEPNQLELDRNMRRVPVQAGSKTTDSEDWYDGLDSEFLCLIKHEQDRVEIAKRCFVAGCIAAQELSGRVVRQPDTEAWWQGLDKPSRSAILYYAKRDDFAKSCFSAGVRHAKRI